MNGTAIRQIETKIWVAPRNRSLLCDGSMNFDPKTGPDIKHAKVTPTALALHSNEMAWFPTPTWLKLENINILTLIKNKTEKFLSPMLSENHFY